MAYKMTPKRRAALRKAQLASARKRRGRGKGKLAKANRSSTRNRRIAVVAATGGLALAAAGVAGAMYARKTASGGPRKKTVASSSKVSLGQSRAGSLTTRVGNKRTRLRNSRRSAQRFNGIMAGTTTWQNVLKVKQRSQTPAGRPGRSVSTYTGTNRRTRNRTAGRRKARSMAGFEMQWGNPNYVWQL